MAANLQGITDEDGQHEDWIEIVNESPDTVSLDGWYLTDNAANLSKWRFPATNIGPWEFIVVFASNKDRRAPGQPLHTNFKLSSSGEYLALVQPGGVTVASHFTPAFPAQATDVSYGFSGENAQTLMAKGAPVKWQVWIGSVQFDAESPGWNTNLSYPAFGWSNGTSGLGWDAVPAGVDYTPYFGANANPQSLMSGQTRALFTRFLPQITNLAAASSIRLRMKYDDGFTAWLNGTEVASDLAPASPSWDSLAAGNRDDTLNGAWAAFDIPVSAAVEGTNLLAIQSFNVSTSSSDLLLLPELDVTYPGVAPSGNYFLAPTPGQSNSAVAVSVPPVVELLSAAPRPPGGTGSPSITVTSLVSQTLSPIAQVTLYHRTMFSTEVAVTMTAVAGGLYTATIPTTDLNPGEMLRWRIEALDSAGEIGTGPRFLDANDNDRYYGTVALNPAETNSLLPILHWFVENFAAAGTTSGTRCSFYYLDRFYDNVDINLHGQSTTSFPKRSHDIDFNAGNRFKWRDGENEVKDANLLSNWADKSKVRNTLAYECFNRAGVPSHWAFPVRVQANSSFYGIMDLVEDGDDRYLERAGLDPDGALYKIYNAEVSGTATWTAEKKTRAYEGNSDLAQFCAGIASTWPLSSRRTYVYDNVNLAETINYLAALVVTSCADQGHKNFYLYRDSNDTLEWQVLPWDVDLTFGHDWTFAYIYFDDTIYTSQPLQLGTVNNLRYIIYNSTELNQMFLRRVRTLMDTLLQPVGTPANLLTNEARINELLDLTDPPGVTNSDADQDLSEWGWWTYGGAQQFSPNPAQEARAQGQRIIDTFLPDRRSFLQFNNPLSSGSPIPSSQPTNANLALEIGDFNPVSGLQEEEYVLLRNTNAYAVDVSGWTLSSAIDYTFPQGTVVPSGGGASGNIGLLYVARSPRAFRQRATGPGDGQNCLVSGPYSGQLSARGETVALHDSAGRAVASVSYAGNPSDVQQFLRITELMYNPAPLPGSTNGAMEFEFIELRNISTNIILDLDGAGFTNGLNFAFTNTTLLPPQQTILLARNPAAFTECYGGGFNLHGPCSTYLDDNGERITLLDAVHEEVLDFTYNDTWFPITDGLGFSLVVVDSYAAPDAWNSSLNWRASGALHGSPDSPDFVPVFDPVKINEALTHTDLPQVDTIELFNPATNSVSLGGWFLTDDFYAPKKYRIPDGTVIAPLGFLVFDENQFNNQPDTNNNFRISSAGDDLWLFGADAATNLTGYYHGFTFGAAANGVSFGRHETSQGVEHFVAQQSFTPGTANSGPLVGPVILRSIMYHPPDLLSNNVATDDDLNEFIELENIAPTNVPLFSAVAPTNTWRLNDAVDYPFPTNLALFPGANLLVVGFNPTNAAQLAAFRGKWALSAGIPVFGPWSGKLDNSADDVKLERPDAPNADGSVPFILVERAQYSDVWPWTPGADGHGAALQRRIFDQYPNDPANWDALPPLGAATPDTDADGLPDWWEWDNGLNSLTNDAALDPDGDTLNNTQEFLGRTNPQDAASFLRLEIVASSNGGVLLNFDAQAQVSYMVQTNGSPASGGWQDWMQVPVAATNRAITLSNAAPGTVQFYRLRAPAD